MDNFRSIDFRLGHPAKGNGMALGHIGTLNHYAIRVLHIARIEGRGAAAETGSQTGNAGTVSDARLVFDSHNSQTAHQLLLNMIPLVIQRRTAQRQNGRRMIDQRAVREGIDKGFIARLFNQFGNPLHRPFKLHFTPFGGTRFSVQHLAGTIGVFMQLVDGRTLGAKSALGVGAARVSFDVYDVSVSGVDDCGAAHRAVRAYTGSCFGSLDADWSIQKSH